MESEPAGDDKPFPKAKSEASAASSSKKPKTAATPSPTAAPSSSIKNQESRFEPYAIVETYIIIPPDGGWGWIIVIVAFFSNFLADGTMYTFGIFLEDISEEVHEPTQKVALINSVMTGSYFISGPLVAALTNRYGYRSVAVAGSIVASVAVFITSYAKKFVTILVVYGIVAGIGFGMMYVSSIIVVGYYFERWRALANSIAATGSSIGIIVFPLLFTILLKHLDWRTKFRIISAMTLVGAFCNLAYRRLEPVRVVTYNEKNMQYGGPSVASLTQNRNASLLTTSVSRYHNLGYPTAYELYGKSTITLQAPSSLSVFIGASGPSMISFTTTKSGFLPTERLQTISEDVEEIDIRKGRCKRFFKLCCCCCEKTSAPTTRPLYRDDIFYSGSVALLPQYTPSTLSEATRGTPWEKSSIEYHMSVTRVPSPREREEAERWCVIFPKSVKRTLATMLDMSLLKQPSFFILSLSGFFSILGLYTPFLFLAERAISHGTEKNVAYNLITALGVANGIGRIVSGIMSSLPSTNALLVSYISLTICGFATLASSLSYSIQFQYACGCIFASTIACVASLRPIIVCEMVGLENLTNGFGINIMFQGLACLVGLPLSSYLITVTGNYDCAFYFAGSVILLSALILMVIPAVMKWEKSRNN